MMWRNNHGERERERGRTEHVMGQVRGEKVCDRGTERQRDSAIKLLRVRVRMYVYVEGERKRIIIHGERERMMWRNNHGQREGEPRSMERAECKHKKKHKCTRTQEERTEERPLQSSTRSGVDASCGQHAYPQHGMAAMVGKHCVTTSRTRQCVLQQQCAGFCTC